MSKYLFLIIGHLECGNFSHTHQAKYHNILILNKIEQDKQDAFGVRIK